MTTDAADRRLMELEILHSHLSHDYDRLNTVVIEQGRDLEHLRRQIAVFEIKLAALLGTAPEPTEGSDPNDPP